MKTREAKKPKVQKQAGGIVLNPRGEVLVITNRQGRTTFPKGSKHIGESNQACSRREIGEETGITDLTMHHELGDIVRPGFRGLTAKKPTIKRIRMFLCTTRQTELRPQESEILEANWLAQIAVAGSLSWQQEAAFFTEHLPLIAGLRT